MDYCEDVLRKSSMLGGYFLGSILLGRSIETTIKKTEESAKGIKFKDSLEKCTNS